MRIVFCCLGMEREKIFNAARSMVLASGLPVEPAKVNKNWPRLSYGPPLAQGQRAEREYLDIYLREPVSSGQVRRQLEHAAPDGLKLLEVQRVPYPLPSVQNLMAAAKYRVQGDFSRLNVSGRKWEDWIKGGALPIVRRAENGLAVTLDGAPYLVESCMPAADELSFTLQEVQGKWLRPEWLLAAWWGMEIPHQEDVFTLEGICVTRLYLLWRDSKGELHPF